MFNYKFFFCYQYLNMKNIAILVRKPENIFTNGCFQQSLFIYQMLNLNDNVNCSFATISSNEDSYSEFDKLIQHPVLNLDSNNVKQFDILLMVSLTLNDKNKNLLEIIRQNNIKLIDLLCGNLFVLLQEEFVFETHGIMKNYCNEYIDEVWVLEMYEYSKEYLELLYNKPVKILRYVWNTDIIKKYISTSNIKIKDNSKLNNDKINILIYEPNMSIHKNAFIPLLIAERYHRENPNRINKIYLFCKESIKSNGYYENMKIYKDGKLEMHGRMIMPMTIKLIQNCNPYKNIILSYTHLNNLNFIHLELFYMRQQIVHNCEPFQNDLQYNSENVLQAVKLIENARLEDTNIEKNIEIICKYNVKNKDIQKDWDMNIKRICL